jgi:hypothetical protein
MSPSELSHRSLRVWPAWLAPLSLEHAGRHKDFADGDELRVIHPEHFNVVRPIAVRPISRAPSKQK